MRVSSEADLETCIGLLPSTEDHAQTDRRTLADFPFPIVHDECFGDFASIARTCAETVLCAAIPPYDFSELPLTNLRSTASIVVEPLRDAPSPPSNSIQPWLKPSSI